MSTTLSGSVGRWERGALNNPADVRTVQQLLTAASRKLAEPQLDPKGIDGKIARLSSSNTIAAIEAFQRRFMRMPDGLIEVGGRTWRLLVEAAQGAQPGTVNPNAGRGPFFPFATLPAVNWTSAPRAFGANRPGGRAHAGCDLYFPHGTWIYAIQDGIVVRGPARFYKGTDALEIDHGSFIARYCEIRSDTLVRKGDRVTAGQKIARVGRLVGVNVPSDMLHLELYDKSASGPLTVTLASESKRSSSGKLFMRRMDLIDPTSLLNQWKLTLPQP